MKIRLAIFLAGMIIFQTSTVFAQTLVPSQTTEELSPEVEISENGDSNQETLDMNTFFAETNTIGLDIPSKEFTEAFNENAKALESDLGITGVFEQPSEGNRIEIFQITDAIFLIVVYNQNDNIQMIMATGILANDNSNLLPIVKGFSAALAAAEPRLKTESALEVTSQIIVSEGQGYFETDKVHAEYALDPKSGSMMFGIRKSIPVEEATESVEAQGTPAAK